MPRLEEFPAGGTLFLDANIFLEHLHRLLLTEAVRRGYVTGAQRALEVLRTKPEILPRLSECDVGLNLLLEAPLRIVSLTPTQFRLAQRLSLRYHLLTNDALHVATLRTHRLRHLASADRDFARVPNLTLWLP